MDGTLADVPGLVLTELDRARRGLVVLAVDGLSRAAAAAAGWPGTATLGSTFPSTSTTAWYTAMTGAGPDRHGVPGMVYRIPGTGELVYAVTGRVLARGPADPGGDTRLVIPQPTVFERATGADCRALAREVGTLPGPWAQALLRGATRVGSSTVESLAADAADPQRLAASVAAEVTEVLASACLLWVYVNLDEYVHRHGYDEPCVAGMAALGEAAARWAQDGWTVLAHSDHGQVRCRRDLDRERAWSTLDGIGVLPPGGAGRVRWLYPHAGREGEARERLADALGPTGRVLTAEETAALAPPGRVGSVAAVAIADTFPVPDAGLEWEHGGLDPGEAEVPLAVWRS